MSKDIGAENAKVSNGRFLTRKELFRSLVGMCLSRAQIEDVRSSFHSFSPQVSRKSFVQKKASCDIEEGPISSLCYSIAFRGVRWNEFSCDAV